MSYTGNTSIFKRIHSPIPAGKLLLAGLIFLKITILFSSISLNAVEPGPERVVKRLNQTLLTAMKQSGELGFQGRYDLLEPVIRESFALEFMLKTSLGRYWRNLGGQQKERLLDLYTRWSAASYAGQFDSYNGQRFEVKPADTSGRWLSVDSLMHKTGGERILFSYVLVQFDGQWNIIDIRVKEVSRLAMTRSQMQAIIEREGLGGLEKMLQEKIEKLSDGSPNS